jgi:hypothetical protein
VSLETTLAKMIMDRARYAERLAAIAEKVAKLDRDIEALRRISAEYDDDQSLPPPPPPPPSSDVRGPSLESLTSAARPDAETFDGTFAGLIQQYRAHDKSPYHQLKHKVRISYDHALDRLTDEIGKERVGDWSASIVQSHYDRWAADNKISAGHNMIGKLRLLSSFGSVVLNDDRCTRLSTILGNLRFPVARVRTEILTMDHARAIRAMAHEHFNWPSIALAQAFQFEIPRLKQVGVIGEWVPLSEAGPSDIIHNDEKWIRGLRWSDIDENMMLRKVIPTGRKNQPKEYEFNLGRAAMIREEINRVPPWKRVGPMIVCEYSLLPWKTTEFRRKWRKVADRAGVPHDVKNMDSGRTEEDDGKAESFPWDMEESPVMQ